MTATSEDSPKGRDRVRLLATLTGLHTANDFFALLLPPLLPALRSALDLSYGQLGFVTFLMTAVSAVFQPTLGYVADRRGWRRWILALGFLGFAFGTVALSMSTSYLALIGAAIILGLAGSTYHPQSATYLVHYFRSNRGFAQGIHGLGNGLGFLLAPLVIAIFVQYYDWRTVVAFLAVPALSFAIVVPFVIREPAIRGGRGLLAGITRPLILLTIVNGLALAASVAFQTWLPSYYASLGYSLSEAGFLTAIMSISGMVAQPLGGALSDTFGRRSIVLGALVGISVFQVVFILNTTGVGMVVATLLVGFCASLVPPVAMVYASELAAGERTGTAVGVVWGMGTLISSLSPLVSGRMIDMFGFVPMYGGLAVVALVAAAVATRLPHAGNARTQLTPAR